MSAAELRKAAKTLRERAASATAGPWIAEQCEDSLQVTAGTASTVWTEHNGFRIGHQPSSYVATDMILEHEIEEWGENPDNATEAQRIADADYIATMHPGVGLALADWLDAMAVIWDGGGKHVFGSTEQRALAAMDGREPDPTSLGGRAFTLARLINGGKS